MGKWIEQALLKRIKNDQLKMFNIFSHQGSVHQNCIDVPSRPSQNGIIKKANNKC
jgi:hypothetical protein